jgi:hypothetical protein
VVSRHKSGLALVAVACVLVVGPRQALGEGPGDVAAALEEAQRASDAGRKQDAVDAVKRAYEISGDINLLFRLGEMTAELGQDLIAYRFYRAYLGRDPRGKHREAADRAARTLEAKLAAPPEPVRAAPAVPSPAPAAATVAVPAAPAPSPPPTAVAPAVDLHAQAAPGPPLPRWLPWISLGATLALGAGAVLTGLEASQRYDELRASCGQTAEGCTQAEIDGVRSRALTANLLWAAAGVGAIASGVSFYVNTREAGLSGVWSY